MLRYITQTDIRHPDPVFEKEKKKKKKREKKKEKKRNERLHPINISTNQSIRVYVCMVCSVRSLGQQDE